MKEKINNKVVELTQRVEFKNNKKKKTIKSLLISLLILCVAIAIMVGITIAIETAKII